MAANLLVTKYYLANEKWPGSQQSKQTLKIYVWDINLECFSNWLQWQLYYLL